MEPFVRRIVAGGLAVVGGLWLVVGFEAGPELSLLGGFLVVIGVVSLLVGLARPVEF